MQRAISGDWVEWKPEIAPQATVMNMIGQIGVPFGCMLVKLISRNGISLRKEHGPNTNSHKDQAETKERMELTDDLINRQEGCNEVVDQQDNQPEVEALGRDLGQKASRARRESNTDEDQEDNGESTHDMSHGIAEVLPYDFGNGGTIISFRQQPRNKVVDTACKTVPKVIQRNTAGPT